MNSSHEAVQPEVNTWPATHGSGDSAVETVELRDGATLILSRFDGGDTCAFHHVETDDVFGIGFHLRGGAQFTTDAVSFETRALDIWAGTAPRGAHSRFTFSPQGFRTVSMRFSLETAQAMLGAEARGEKRGNSERSEHLIKSLLASNSPNANMLRLGALTPAAARAVEDMFNAPYTGTARRLFLELRALELLAAQLAAQAEGTGEAPCTDERKLKTMLAAREYLDAHFKTPPTLTRLARIVGTNEFTLKKTFKQAFGVTVFAYIRQRRMEMAAYELQQGRAVSDVALDVGYRCPRCFADAFRRHFGILPSVARATVRPIHPVVPPHHG